jgi:hypothetical protein
MTDRSDRTNRTVAVALALALALAGLPATGNAQELTASAGEDDSSSENMTLLLLGAVVVVALVVAWRVDVAGKQQAEGPAPLRLALNDSESVVLKLDGFKNPGADTASADEYVTGLALRAEF